MSDDSVPAYSAVAIVNDAVIVACRAIYVGVAGDISVNLATTGTAVIFKNALAGSIIPIRAIKVNATGTTATNLIALY